MDTIKRLYMTYILDFIHKLGLWVHELIFTWTIWPKNKFKFAIKILLNIISIPFFIVGILISGVFTLLAILFGIIPLVNRVIINIYLMFNTILGLFSVFPNVFNIDEMNAMIKQYDTYMQNKYFDRYSDDETLRYNALHYGEEKELLEKEKLK